MQTIRKPPRSDNIRKRNGRSERKPAPHSLRAERQQYRSAPETDFASACLSRTRAPVAPNTRLYPTQPHLRPQLCHCPTTVAVFYRIFSYICFNRIAPATTDRAAARRPLSVFIEYISYICLSSHGKTVSVPNRKRTRYPFQRPEPTYERRKKSIQDKRGAEPVQRECGLPATHPLHDGEPLHHRQPPVRSRPVPFRQYLDALFRGQPAPALVGAGASENQPRHVDTAVSIGIRRARTGLSLPHRHAGSGHEFRLVLRSPHRGPQRTDMEGERRAEQTGAGPQDIQRPFPDTLLRAVPRFRMDNRRRTGHVDDARRVCPDRIPALLPEQHHGVALQIHSEYPPRQAARHILLPRIFQHVPLRPDSPEPGGTHVYLLRQLQHAGILVRHLRLHGCVDSRRNCSPNSSTDGDGY